MPTTLAALALVTILGLLLSRLWPEHARPLGALLWPALGAVLLARAALVAASFAAPQARLAALRADPMALLGGGTGGAPLFDLVAAGLAVGVGDRAAVEALALAGCGASLLLVSVLARAAGLGEPAARLSPLALLAMPVSLMPLALDARGALAAPALALLLVHLLRRFARLEGARDAAAAFLFLLLAGLAGAQTDAALAVGVFVTAELLTGDRLKALRLLGAAALALLVAVAAGGCRAAPGPGATGLAAGSAALLLSLGPVPLLLLAAGRAALAAAPRPAARLLGSALLAGVCLGLAGRGAGATLPCVVAALAAAGFARVWGAAQSPASRVQSETQSA